MYDPLRLCCSLTHFIISETETQPDLCSVWRRSTEKNQADFTEISWPSEWGGVAVESSVEQSCLPQQFCLWLNVRFESHFAHYRCTVLWNVPLSFRQVSRHVCMHLTPLHLCRERFSGKWPHSQDVKPQFHPTQAVNKVWCNFSFTFTFVKSRISVKWSHCYEVMKYFMSLFISLKWSWNLLSSE